MSSKLDKLKKWKLKNQSKILEVQKKAQENRVEKEEDFQLVIQNVSLEVEKKKNSHKLLFDDREDDVVPLRDGRMDGSAMDEGIDETGMDAAQEEDPLELYMQKLQKKRKRHDEVTLEDVQKGNFTIDNSGADDQTFLMALKRKRYNSFDVEEPSYVQKTEDHEVSRKKSSVKKYLETVDHSQISYPPFRKNFFIVPKVIEKELESKSIRELQKQIDKISISGKDCPPPIYDFKHCGLSDSVLEVIKENSYSKPFSIQALSIPAIMSGRDMIGIARTGSGKTLCFVLPMIRHILDQPPLKNKDGPIGLIMAPTRELAVQIHEEVEKFTKKLKLNSLCVYGGASVADQISSLKKPVHIVVCTPGRMIDLLCLNNGKVTNLARVTYVCIDEADRMFDMGFGPQITKIIRNIRPDKQIVMFSATFPRQLEALARKFMNNQLEIVVGGKSVASSNIKQHVEVMTKDRKFIRLLELLGEWHTKGSILIFVDRQEECGTLFKELVDQGYEALCVHGGMDQVDRDDTLETFKSEGKSIMVATSVLARGLDVRGLELVINYNVPDHYEDYVHRVGRTGRAEKSGSAYTFITIEEEHCAPFLVKALKKSKNAVPEDLERLARDFSKKKQGSSRSRGGWGFGGHGFQFDQSEEQKFQKQQKSKLVRLGVIEESESTETPVPSKPISVEDAIKSAQEFAIKASLQNMQNISNEHQLKDQFDINDFPQKIRWNLTTKDKLDELQARTGTQIICKGSYFKPGEKPPPGSRKLYLEISSDSKETVSLARKMIQEIIDDLKQELKTSQVGRYNV